MANAKASRLNGDTGQGGPLNDGVSDAARAGVTPPVGEDTTVIVDGIAQAAVTVLDSGNTRVDY